ncbi:unnamed protein product [Anisakis simplex]|uniref:SERPIN domain-containing protein n=1 Tax=Anisakis simplex TaxID=6269 RepID=A0A0M3KH82_ANISI|nr:unnamed protein product [Anisakis simplex]
MVRFRSVVLSSSSQPNVVKGSYQWNDYLEKILTKVNESGEGDNRISEYVVPAECFFEAPFVEFARYIVKNLKVEVALEEDTASLLADESISLFWVASVQKVCSQLLMNLWQGYKMKYLGNG